ncbi:sensor histidine kinase [Azohydromonas aeria]|uniref:sensor histidine kinase n=1 Tax=Azohydromonas aeria TaxID=2590212 RepID=UPI0012FC92DB|nr:ATP-binding protein [Azohydromonas aeria]
MATLFHRTRQGTGGWLPTCSLRAYLVAWVIAIELPLVAFAVMQAVRDAQHQRRNIESGLLSTARTIAVAVEQELQGSISALTALAATRELEGGDLEAFYDEARHVRDVQPWYSVWLIEPDGAQVMNLLRPFGSGLPSLREHEYVGQMPSARRALVSGLMQDPLDAQPFIAITVPVVQQGSLRYLLVAGMRPEALTGFVAAPPGGVAQDVVSIMDRDFRVLARAPRHAAWAGQQATPEYRALVSRGLEGVATSRTLEGDLSYMAYRRLGPGGWTVGVGTPASAVDGPLALHVSFTAAIGLTMLLVAIATARLLGQRVTRPIEQLAQGARDIADDRVPRLCADTPLKEVADLRVALQRAGEAIAQRHRMLERERRFALELAAAEDRERQQIARDLHDGLGQTLAALQIRLAALCRHADPDVTRTAHEIAALARRADRSSRCLSEQLAPPVLYDLGLLPALDWLADEMRQQFSLSVRIDDDDRPKPLMPEIRSLVYRSVRELLINVAKHACCDAADVVLRSDGPALCVTVRDHGVGLDDAHADADADAGLQRRGMGLRSVRERLSRIGGQFDIRSFPGQGTEAVLQVPLAVAAIEEAAS